MFRKADSLGIYCRNRSVSFQSHTKHFCQTVHAIGGIHAGTGPARRTDFILIFCHFLFCHRPCCVGSHRLKHTRETFFASFNFTCKHWTSAYKHSRNIDSCCRHQKSRYIFVTVWNHNQSIKLMCKGHSLCRIRNEISRHKRIFHPRMSHSNSITYRNGREHNRCSSCHCHTHFYRIGNLIKIHMSRYNFIIRADDAHQRFFQFFVCKSKCVKKGSVRGLLHSFCYCITFHLYLLLVKSFYPLADQVSHLCRIHQCFPFRYDVLCPVTLF